MKIENGNRTYRVSNFSEFVIVGEKCDAQLWMTDAVCARLRLRFSVSLQKSNPVVTLCDLIITTVSNLIHRLYPVLAPVIFYRRHCHRHQRRHHLVRGARGRQRQCW